MEQKNTADYSLINAPRFFSRFLSVVIDVFIVGVLTLFFSFITISIINNSSFYKEQTSVMENEARVCFKMSEESRLITYNGSGTGDEHYSSSISQNEVFKSNLRSHIFLSFNNDNSYFVSKGVTSLEFEQGLLPASFETDELAYFYYHFVKDNNDKYQIVDLSIKSYQNYHYDLFKEYEPKINDNYIWVLDNVGDFPILKGEYAYDAYMYLKDNKTSEFENVYNALNVQYNSMWNAEYKQLTASPTYKLHYDNYQSAYKLTSVVVDVGLIASFVISFIIGYLVPSLVTRLHRTLGKKAEYIYIVSNDDTDASKKQIVFRTLLKIFPYFGFSFIPNMILGFFNQSWSYPLFYIGSFGVSLSILNVAFIIIALISFIITITDYKKRSIADFICKTRLIDYQEYKEKEVYISSSKDKKEKFETIDSNSLENKDK